MQCTSDYTSAGTCNLIHYSSIPDKLDVWFPNDTTLGGYSDAMDYVPIYQTYMNCKDTNGPDYNIINSRLTDSQLKQVETVNTIRGYGNQVHIYISRTCPLSTE